jgi:VWFA-related protein
MRRRTLILTVVVAAALCAWPRAQTPSQTAPPPPPPQQKQVFRAAIDAVSVDVIVTDAQGNPVSDLKPEDFDIKENSKPQKIDTFKLVKVDDEIDVDPAHYPEIHSLQDQERETARDDMRLIVVFLDDYHVKRGNDVVIRQQLSKFFAQLSPKDLVAVMYPLTPTSALTFSRDHANTANIIAKFVGRKYEYQPQNSYEDIYMRMTHQQIEDLRNQVTISALTGLCTYLGSLRDGRKTVLFVSEGFLGLLPEAVTRPAGASVPVGPTGDSMHDRAGFMASMEVMGMLRRVFEEAAQGNTSVYTIDPRGLATNEFDLSQPNVDYRADRAVLNETMDTLRALAGETDGRAIVNQNDAGPSLKQMLRDTSAYYLLGYTSTESKRDGKFHEIKVTLKRKGLTVRARKGYWAYSPEDFAKAAAPSTAAKVSADVDAALADLATPPRGHVVQTWVGFDRGEDGKAAVTLVWEMAEAAPTGRDVPDRLDVTAGSSSGELAFRGRVAKDPRSPQPAGRVTFAAKPGPLQLRMTAQTADGTEVDTDTRDVVVPDFTAVGPTITTPQVFRARTARDAQQIAAGGAALPTTGHEFSRAERLVVRFHAYGPAASTPVIALRLLNRIGDTMSTLPDPVRSADGTYQMDLALGGLAAGEYLIEIEAVTETGKTRALIAFTVTA